MFGLTEIETCTALGLVGFWLAGRPVVLDLDSWEAIAHTLGPRTRWTTDSSRGQLRPVLRHPDHGRMKAARVMAGARPDQEVGYRDGDAFNLRRCNLVLSDALRLVRRGVPLPVLGGPALAKPQPGVSLVPPARSLCAKIQNTDGQTSDEAIRRGTDTPSGSPIRLLKVKDV